MAFISFENRARPAAAQVAVDALSARDIAVAVGVAERAGQQGLAERARIEPVADARCETLRQLDPAHERIGRGPARGNVVVTRGRTRAPYRLAELRQHGRGLHVAEVLPAKPAHRRNGPVPRRLELRVDRRPRLRQIEQSPVHGRQVAAVCAERARQPIDSASGGGLSATK